MELLDRSEDVVETQRGKRAYSGLQSLMRQSLLSYSAAFDVAESDGVWTVTDRETGIFGAGPDEDAALRDFVSALTEHRDVLERQEALSEELETQLRYLRRLFGQ
jgi:hypothetical protein